MLLVQQMVLVLLQVLYDADTGADENNGTGAKADANFGDADEQNKRFVLIDFSSA